MHVMLLSSWAKYDCLSNFLHFPLPQSKAKAEEEEKAAEADPEDPETQKVAEGEFAFR